MREKRAFNGVYCSYPPPPPSFVCLNSVKDGFSRTFASAAFRLRNAPVPCGFVWTRKNLDRNIPVAVRCGRKTFGFVRRLQHSYFSMSWRRGAQWGVHTDGLQHRVLEGVAVADDFVALHLELFSTKGLHGMGVKMFCVNDMASTEKILLKTRRGMKGNLK